MNQDDLIKKIVNKLNANELTIVAIILGIVVLKWIKIPGTNPIILIIITSICTIYYFSSFEKVSDGNMQHNFIIKLTGLASALALIGILFALFYWPNSKILLYLSIFSLVASLIGSKITNLIGTPYYTQNKMLRIITLLILTVFCLFFL